MAEIKNSIVDPVKERNKAENPSYAKNKGNEPVKKFQRIQR